MNASYPEAAQVGNSAPSPGALSFYRWLYRWHSQTGCVCPSTGYLAHKQGKTERTVYRWLAELRSCSYIATEVDSGVSRRIVPLVEPSTRPGRSRLGTDPNSRPATNPDSRLGTDLNSRSVSGVMSGVVSGVMSGVLHEDAYTQDTTTQGNHVAAAPLPEVAGVDHVAAAPHPELVEALCNAGVSASIAAGLVADRGANECREQLEALPYRKPSDAPAVLVASIRGKWAMPGALVREREKKALEVVRSARVQARAIVQAKQQEQQNTLLSRLSALPGSVYASLEARAVNLWHQEQPAAAKIMQGRSGASSVVQRYMVRILEMEGGGVHA